MKVLLIPLGILAFILLLIVLGAIGLGIALLVLAFFRGVWKLLSFPFRWRRRRRS
ncbi:MAG: hypothetical protein R2725_08850 [Solirubrobacterales bacterium]